MKAKVVHFGQSINGQTIAPGALPERAEVPILENFDHSKFIGRATVFADGTAELTFADPKAARAARAVGAMATGWSIGYRVKESRMEGEERIVTALDLLMVGGRACDDETPLRALIKELRARTWLSPVSAKEMTERDRFLADTLEAIANADQWLPIESAPRDGSVLLLYGCAHQRHWFGTGYYFQPIGPKSSEGWIAHSFRTIPNDSGGCFEPSHWMPMLVPPRSEA